MIALLDNCHDLEVCGTELRCDVGQLLTPLTRRLLRDPSKPWAVDNGAFASFDAQGFMTLLERRRDDRATCVFVAVPDVVGSARRTLEVFEFWKGKLDGWPLALVCQDGQEHLPIPWGDITAVFIGGTTAWKMSGGAGHIVKAAKAMGKWVHVGRVNSPQRWEYFEELGADSADGTGIARYTHMRRAIGDRGRQSVLALAKHEHDEDVA